MYQRKVDVDMLNAVLTFRALVLRQSKEQGKKRTRKVFRYFMRPLAL